ncbi:hypothetical protein [Spiroplasma taiwanense]|uniref:hypothetical protein n=1 Tax=Spiroplasma taiwanense TaxID=2145 RepID=UPI0011D244CE|nr:hypothetical protein [Spiroplasma taiwanense]
MKIILNFVNQISNYIVPLSVFHSLRENGFSILECEVSMEKFREIVNNSNPVVCADLLKAFYLYYKIFLSKYLIFKLKEKNSTALEWVLESEKIFGEELAKSIKTIESKIVH